MPQIARFSTPIGVRAKSIRTLFQEHAMRHLTVLVIDAEGLDEQVLRTVFETEVRPDIKLVFDS